MSSPTPISQPDTHGAGSQGAHAPRLALAGLCLSMLMPSLDTSIANAGLPAMAQAFGATFQAVQWIVLAYLLAITTLIVGVGRLGDLLGRRRLLLAGIGLFTLASLLCGIAPSLGWLIAARAVQGLGAAIMMALSMASVGAAVTRERSGSGMGLLGTMSALGTTLGPALGGMLISGAGWHAIFLVNIPLGVVNFVLVYRHLPQQPASQPGAARVDVPGMALLALTLGAYALGMTSDGGQAGWRNLALLALAAMSGAWFVLVESRATHPLLNLAMFRDRVLSTGLLLGALVAAVVMSTLIVGPFYLSGTLGLSATSAGLALSVGPLVAALAGLPAGRLVDRVGAQDAATAGLVGMAAGCLALSCMPAAFGLPAYLVPIALITASYALFQAANNTMLVATCAPTQRGVVAGMLSLSRNLGLITGAAAMGAIFARAASISSGAPGQAAAIASGMHCTFGVATALMGSGLGIALYARRGQSPGSSWPGRQA